LFAADAGFRDVSVAQYEQHLQQLDGLVANCQVQRTRKSPAPANDNACDPKLVGPDDRVQLPSGAREVRYDWLRAALTRATSKETPAQAQSGAIGRLPGTPNPPLAVDALLAEARSRLQQDAKQAATPDVPAQNYATERQSINTILSQRAYQGVTSRSATDRVREWFYNQLDKILASLIRFGSRSPWIAFTLRVLLLVAICTALLWFLVRIERRSRVRLIPDAAPASGAPSAREWQLWLKDAQAMAAQGMWREAIHFLYWASIARLESRRLWPADRARTPREYLRLLAGADPRKPTLTALTQSFERTWYGGRAAEPADFKSALELAATLGVSAE
jgi:hypothetical protein